MSLTLGERLTASADRDPAAPAVWDSDAWHSWGQWRDDAARFGAALQRRGVEQGDVVGLHLPNGWEFLAAHTGAAMIGAITFPLHTNYGSHELAQLTARVRLKALVAPAELKGADKATDARAALAESHPDALLVVVGASTRSAGEIGWDELLAEQAPHELTAVALDEADVLAYLASSGTSSTRPKICVHTHGGLLGNALGVAEASGMHSDDVTLSASPFTHAFGLLSVHLSIVTGGGQALLPGWSAAGFIDTATASGATVGFAVPAQLRDVTATLPAKPLGLRLRQVRTGGAPVPGELVRTIGERLGSDIVLQWGMSELGAGTYTRPGDSLELITSTIGRPGDGAEVRVVTDDGADAEPGTVGSLQYRGPSLLRGYLGDDTLTAAAIDADGWLTTGDLAVLGDDGYVRYAGRTTEFINRGGLKFSVVEVENLIAELDGVAQLAVVPRDDERLGQRSVLMVTLREGAALSLDEVTAHLAARGLAKYKWPEELHVVDELPTTPTGKIARARIVLP